MIKALANSRFVQLAALGLAITCAVAPDAWAAGGCGPNRFRDRFGYCHFYGGPGVVYRTPAFVCPPGTHLGAGGRACWPNR